MQPKYLKLLKAAIRQYGCRNYAEELALAQMLQEQDQHMLGEYYFRWQLEQFEMLEREWADAVVGLSKRPAWSLAVLSLAKDSPKGPSEEI